MKQQSKIKNNALCTNFFLRVKKVFDGDFKELQCCYYLMLQQNQTKIASGKFQFNTKSKAVTTLLHSFMKMRVCYNRNKFFYDRQDITPQVINVAYSYNTCVKQ